MHIYTYLRVGHGFGNDPMSGEVGDVRHGGVRAVEQPQLHALVYVHVLTGHEQRVGDVLPRRPPVDKRLLDHLGAKGQEVSGHINTHAHQTNPCYPGVGRCLSGVYNHHPQTNTHENTHT